MLRRAMMAGASSAGVVVTWNPSDKHADIALSGGDLIATKTTAGDAWRTVRATAAHGSGKHYFEVVNAGASVYLMVGVANASDALDQFVGVGIGSAGYYSVTGQKFHQNVAAAYGATFASGDVIGVAWDASTTSVEFFKNNVSQGVAYTGLTGATKYPAISIFQGGSTKTVTGRFKLADFSYTPPTGYSAWGI